MCRRQRVRRARRDDPGLVRHAVGGCAEAGEHEHGLAAWSTTSAIRPTEPRSGYRSAVGSASTARERATGRLRRRLGLECSRRRAPTRRARPRRRRRPPRARRASASPVDARAGARAPGAGRAAGRRLEDVVRRLQGDDLGAAITRARIVARRTDAIGRRQRVVNVRWCGYARTLAARPGSCGRASGRLQGRAPPRRGSRGRIPLGGSCLADERLQPPPSVGLASMEGRGVAPDEAGAR